MTQALFGNLNNTLNQQNMADNLSNLKGSVKTTSFDNKNTDFQQLFAKQNAISQNDKSKNQSILTPAKTNYIGNSSLPQKASGEKTTLAASVENIYQDINDLMSLLKLENIDESSDKEIVEGAVEEVAEVVEETVEDTVADIATEISDNVDILSTIQNVIAPQSTVVVQNEDVQADEDINLDDELTVTLNGKDLDSFLNDFELNNVAEEVIIAKPDIKSNEVESKSLDELVDEETLKELNIESIEVETSNDDSSADDFMQNQTPEEHGIKAMLNTQPDFAEVKTEIQTSVQAAQKVSQTTQTTSDKIIEQISKQMENLQNGSKVNLIMNPESLGKVSIQLINTEEGLSAQFTVATQDAKNLIMKGLDGLKETLLAHGVNVDNVTVKLSEAQEGEYNSDWTEQEGSRGGNKEQNQNKQNKEQENFEQMMSFEKNDIENGNV